MKYAWIAENCGSYPVKTMCRVLEVSTSGYYAWRGRKPSPRQQRRQAIAEVAAEVYHENDGIYGYRKVHDTLLDQQMECCRETVRRILREKGLFSRTQRRFVVTTDSNHTMSVAENVLDRDFTANAPNEKWAADITYLATGEGWFYVSVVMDLFSRRIVGWSMSESLEAKLVLDALTMAVEQRRPNDGLLHHSDRGSQYASDAFQGLLDQQKIICSMSRRGDCWDNAPMESFFGKLKTEWTRDKRYATRKDAEADVFKYIELFYNRKRKHAALGYVSPVAFEESYNSTLEQAA